MDQNTEKAMELFQLQKVGNHCALLFKEPGPDLWQKVGVGIFTFLGIILGFIWGWANYTGFFSVTFFSILGALIAGGVLFSLSYLTRHAVSKVLARWKIGFPSLLVAIGIFYIDPNLGVWAIIAAIFIWAWPLWPLLVILLALFVAVAPALSKAGGSFGNKR